MAWCWWRMAPHLAPHHQLSLVTIGYRAQVRTRRADYYEESGSRYPCSPTGWFRSLKRYLSRARWLSIVRCADRPVMPGPVAVEVCPGAGGPERCAEARGSSGGLARCEGAVSGGRGFAACGAGLVAGGGMRMGRWGRVLAPGRRAGRWWRAGW